MAIRHISIKNKWNYDGNNNSNDGVSKICHELSPIAETPLLLTLDLKASLALLHCTYFSLIGSEMKSPQIFVLISQYKRKRKRKRKREQLTSGERQ